jgi:hypothetical protein
MAVYKVPQDVEADDKLIGPFSFRQFIYLIVVAISGAGAWGLAQVFLALAIIPLPFMVFFAVLALPLRKDQPMETYLTAVVQFYFLKSRKRFWVPDGIDSFVMIIPPKDADKILTKNLDEDEATRRLGYLADLVDSHGWSVRGAGVGSPDTSVSSDLYYESQQTVDMMDNNTSEAQSLDQKLQASNDAYRQSTVTRMQTAQPAAPAPLQTSITDEPDDTIASQPVSFNPIAVQEAAVTSQSTKSYLDKNERDAIAYASALAEEAESNRNETPPTTSENTVTTDTIERAKQRAEQLATRDDLTIQTLSGEANRLEKKDQMLSDGDEVTISLR